MNISLKTAERNFIRSRKNHVLGRCPACGCEDANFNLEKMVWNCWHCPESGAITTEGGTFIYVEPEVKELDIPAIRKVYKLLADKYHMSLNTTALDYLHSRGFSDDTISKFKLGFCSTEYVEEYDDPLAEDAGVVTNNYPLLTNRITIPYIYHGEIVDIRGRTVEGLRYRDDTPKYLSLAGRRSERGAEYLFNQDIVENSNTIIITEGEFKAILASQYGFAVVATPGVSIWNKEWGELFKDKEVILAADNEMRSGLNSPAYAMAKTLNKSIPHLKIAVLFKTAAEKKVDIDSLILTRGVKAFELAIKSAMDSNKWLKIQERKGHVRTR